MPSAFEWNTFGRLHKIFADLGWNNHTSRDISELFNSFCQLLEPLSQLERDLILELTSDFLWCTIDRYQALLSKSMALLDKHSLGAGPDVFLVPLSRPKDWAKAKSGTTVAYLIDELENDTGPLKGKNIVPLAHINGLADNKYKLRVNATIIFVDDFIGSGETADEVLTEYESDFKNETDTALAVVLVAQEVGLASLRSRLNTAVAAIVRRKGISESERLPDKESAKATMLDIERRMNVDPEYRFGYLESEALVAMARTPDNTFPFYWYTREGGTDSRKAPFPRRRN